MPYKPLTHETFHSGMAGTGNDGKWSDMLNFRAAGGKTETTPPKKIILPAQSLHTIASLGKNVNYAFGADQSLIFTGNDELQAGVLWKVTATHRTKDDELPRGLSVRGQYLGGEKRYRVTYVDQKAKVEVMEETVTPPGFNCYGCCNVAPDGSVVDINGVSKVQVIGTVVTELGYPIPGAIVKIFQHGQQVFQVAANGTGHWVTLLIPGSYVVEASQAGFVTKRFTYTLTTTDTVEIVLYQPTNTRLLKAGSLVVIEGSFPAQLEEVGLGLLNINGLDFTQTGGYLNFGSEIMSFSSEFELDRTAVDLIYATQGQSDIYDFGVAFDPPESSGTVTVYDDQGQVLFLSAFTDNMIFTLPAP